MAPKAKYTRNRLAAAAADEALEVLTCECVHVAEETSAFADGSLRRAALLTFRWRLKTRTGHEEHATVTARTNNVAERGVPLPSHWRTAMQ